MECSMPGFLFLHYLPKFAPNHVHWVGGFPASGYFPMSLLFCFRWSKYWSFSISPSSDWIFRVDFVRCDGFGLLAVQATLKSLLLHHNLKVSILWCPVFLWSNSNICTWLLEKPQLWLYRALSAKWCLCILICCLGHTKRANSYVGWSESSRREGSRDLKEEKGHLVH